MLKKQIHNLAASALIVTLMLTVAGSSFASWQSKESDPEIKQKREEMHQIIEDGSFEDFKLMIESQNHPHAEVMLEGINEENFARFQEAHQLMREGREKIEVAHDIFEELGISNKGHHKFKKRMMKPSGNSDIDLRSN